MTVIGMVGEMGFGARTGTYFDKKVEMTEIIVAAGGSVATGDGLAIDFC